MPPLVAGVVTIGIVLVLLAILLPNRSAEQPPAERRDPAPHEAPGVSTAAALPASPERADPAAAGAPGPATDTEAVATEVLQRLQRGESATVIRQEILARGAHEGDLTPVLDVVVGSWRTATEASSRKMFQQGALWCGGGLLVTFLTYMATDLTGGSYLLAYGPMIYGGAQMFRAQARLSGIRQQCDLPP